MELNQRENRKHVALIILLGYIGNLVFAFLGYALFPPTYENGLPHYAPGLLYMGEISAALVILATSLMAIKLADEKQVLPSAGFTMMAISQGVFFVTIFEAFGADITHEQLEKAYNIQVGGMVLYMPALFLISFYTYFPRWLRIASIVACIPYFICNGYFMAGYRDFKLIDIIGGIGGITLGTVQILWGVWVWKRRYHE